MKWIFVPVAILAAFALGACEDTYGSGYGYYGHGYYGYDHGYHRGYSDGPYYDGGWRHDRDDDD
jgi:hypothetical protein